MFVRCALAGWHMFVSCALAGWHMFVSCELHDEEDATVIV